MGIVNVTPDSFSDGGDNLDPTTAIRHAQTLIADGASIVDIGGESTRPGAEGVALDEEIARVIPVIEGLAQAKVEAQLSIDTSKLGVAQAAVAAGASYINDVTAFRSDPQLAGFVAEADLECCLMHMQGEPRTMQQSPKYNDVIAEVKAFLTERMEFAVKEGVAETKITLDPGFGYGKTVAHNLELIRRIDELIELGRPILIGASRKASLGVLTGREPKERVAATVAINVMAFLGGATVFRVHDVRATKDALTVTAATFT